MIRFLLSLIVGISLFFNEVYAQEFKFPDNSNYVNNIPTPTKFFGYEIGAWHPDYFQVVAYTKALDEISDRVQTQTIGFTHQQKPLQAVIISSPQNLQKLEENNGFREIKLGSEITNYTDAIYITDQK